MMFAVSEPLDMDGILMSPASLEISWTSTMTVGPAGLFMYESSASMSSTSPTLLAIMVRAFAFLNCLCKSGNCTLIMCIRSASAPCALVSKSGENLEKERLSPLQSTVVSFLVAIAPSSLSKRIRKYPLVKIVVEAKEVGRWSFRHSWRALNEAFPPNVRPITVLRAFFIVAPSNSITISVGNSASNSILGCTRDGPWGSAPVGVVGLGPLLGCVVRTVLGGVVELMVGLPLEASLLFGSDSLAGNPPLATHLTAVAPRNFELWPLPASTENNSGMRERGVEILGRT